MVIDYRTPGVLAPILVWNGDQLVGRVWLVDTELKIAYQQTDEGLLRRVDDVRTTYLDGSPVP